MPSRTPLVLVVGDELAVDGIGDPPLQTAQRLLRCLALGKLAPVVRRAVGSARADLGDGPEDFDDRRRWLRTTIGVVNDSAVRRDSLEQSARVRPEGARYGLKTSERGHSPVVLDVVEVRDGDTRLIREGGQREALVLTKPSNSRTESLPDDATLLRGCDRLNLTLSPYTL